MKINHDSVGKKYPGQPSDAFNSEHKIPKNEQIVIFENSQVKDGGRGVGGIN